MPGKLCDGNANPELKRTPLPREAMAFCMGRKANDDGSAITANPWDNATADSPEEYLESLWDQGWNHFENTPLVKGCCAQ